MLRRWRSLPPPQRLETFGKLPVTAPESDSSAHLPQATAPPLQLPNDQTCPTFGAIPPKIRKPVEPLHLLQTTLAYPSHPSHTTRVTSRCCSQFNISQMRRSRLSRERLGRQRRRTIPRQTMEIRRIGADDSLLSGTCLHYG